MGYHGSFRVNINEKGSVNYNILYKHYSYFDIIMFYAVHNSN